MMAMRMTDEPVQEPTPHDEVATLTGRTQLRRSAGPVRLRYYLWQHPQACARSRWLIAVHGISRDAREQVRLLQPQAQRRGYSIVAPLFDADMFPRYQQLAGGARTPAADVTLCALHDELVDRLGAPKELDLFGFSGGAQFCHRFAMLHPSRVRRLVLAAAGWYTLPTSDRAWPYGVGGQDDESAPAFQLDAFAAIPQLVLVGEADETRDPALRKRRHLDREQGRTRVQRARSWTASMHALAALQGLAPATRLKLLPGVGHAFADAVRLGRLDQHLFEFLDPMETSP